MSSLYLLHCDFIFVLLAIAIIVNDIQKFFRKSYIFNSYNIVFFRRIAKDIDTAIPDGGFVNNTWT